MTRLGYRWGSASSIKMIEEKIVVEKGTVEAEVLVFFFKQKTAYEITR